MPTCSLKSKELCVFAYEDLGLFADFATLSTPPEVLDILLTFLSAALNCKRKELLLDPYPLIRYVLIESLFNAL